MKSAFIRFKNKIDVDAIGCQFNLGDSR